jgi:hypothetical protein
MSVEIIRRYCFANNGSLAELSFESDSHIKTIGDGAFQDCQLKRIIVPGSVDVCGDVGCRVVKEEDEQEDEEEDEEEDS